MKLNFYRSKESGSVDAGSGFIIRNDIGKLLAAGAIYMQTNDVNIAETRGLWEGLCWINYKLSAELVWVEGDSLNATNSLKGMIEGGGSNMMIGCRNLMWRLWSTKASHVFREANSVTDWLANYGRISRVARYWMANFSDELIAIMQ